MPNFKYSLTQLILTALLAATPSGLDSIVELLHQIDDPAFQEDLLKGMREGLAGQKNVPPPKGWPELAKKLIHSPSEKVREEATNLGLIFGDQAAIKRLKYLLKSKSANISVRKKSLKILTERKAPKLVPILYQILQEELLRAEALMSLAAFDHPETPEKILKLYPELSQKEKTIAVATLASRKLYARALTEALAKGTVRREEIDVPAARQIKALNDPQTIVALNEHWGTLQPSTGDKEKRMSVYKKFLTTKYLAKADLVNGRRLYNRSCSACHKLYGIGGDIGPDITGSDRRNLDYILDNVLDPSGAVSKDFQLNTILLKDGRLVSGMVSAENKSSLTVRSTAETLVVSKQDIKKHTVLPISMMPPGLLEALEKNEVRDLVAYLATEQQVELPEEAN